MYRMVKKYFALLLVCAMLFLATIPSALAVEAQSNLPSMQERFGSSIGGMLSLGTTQFTHLDYTLNASGGLSSVDKNINHAVTETFGTLVVENSSIIATFVPDYGGRLLSIVNKATGHEALYQNPLGVPYGYTGSQTGDGVVSVDGGWQAFYYDWLMVYGGVFPTFSEPEHGKYWYLPWDCTILANNADCVSIKMTQTDNIDYWGSVGKQSKFNNGTTGLVCEVIYTVYANRSYVEMEINLTNPGEEAVAYEYWTCTTLAPGTNTLTDDISRNSEIVAPLTTVNVRDDYGWMRNHTALPGSPEADGKYYRAFDDFANFSDWDMEGICYAWDLSSDWWGVINHTNEEGILRIADNVAKTPGMKFWTWGYNQSYDWDGSENNSPRPYIELWAGNSKQFFDDATLGAGQTISWTEYYYPTVGMDSVTEANENGAIHFWVEKIDGGYLLCSIFNTTLASDTLNYKMYLNGATSRLLVDTDYVDTAGANTFSVFVSDAELTDANYSISGVLSDATGTAILYGSIPVAT